MLLRSTCQQVTVGQKAAYLYSFRIQQDGPAVHPALLFMESIPWQNLLTDIKYLLIIILTLKRVSNLPDMAQRGYHRCEISAWRQMNLPWSSVWKYSVDPALQGVWEEVYVFCGMQDASMRVVPPNEFWSLFSRMAGGGRNIRGSAFCRQQIVLPLFIIRSSVIRTGGFTDG